MKPTATRAALFDRGKHGMDEALKAGIGATAGSALILALVFAAMHALSVGVG